VRAATDNYTVGSEFCAEQRSNWKEVPLVPAYIVLNGRFFDPDRTAIRWYVERIQPPLAAALGDGTAALLSSA
jgi:hypothetical protein